MIKDEETIHARLIRNPGIPSMRSFRHKADLHRARATVLIALKELCVLGSSLGIFQSQILSPSGKASTLTREGRDLGEQRRRCADGHGCDVHIGSLM